MTTKWTKGPWKVDEVTHPKGCSLGVYSEEYGQFCNHAYLQGPRGDSEVEANAHLIASAPVLYDALEQSLAAIDRLRYGSDSENIAEIVMQGDHALRQARGENGDNNVDTK